VISRVLVEGTGSGEVLILDEPVSFWGGVDPTTGLIVDVHHPQHGQCISGRVMVMPHGRGSSGASSVLSEAIRLGTAPAGIVLDTADPLVAFGSMVASELYQKSIPVVVADDIGSIPSGHVITIDGQGLTIGPQTE
jgi:predicted aconitase with swiveling domain